MKTILLLSLAGALSACSSGGTPDGAERANANDATTGGNMVATSGKSDVPLAEVPAQVLAAANAARPGFKPAEAETEVRDGRRYFDIEGRLPDGSEIEFDILEEGGSWRVVETQRDIAFAAVPAPVRAAHKDGFEPSRVIESVQADGLVIYELFGARDGDPQGRKVEIKWDGSKAERLDREWAH